MRSLFCLAAALLALPAVAANTPNELQRAALAATCANCHGPQGRAVERSEVPGLAGMAAPYLIEQMNAFRNGTRPATVMHQLAKGYTPAQIEQLAQYFAAQPR
ncbi:c-type cytochrome [Ideonella sp.]|jgi:sulfide dehydrogenase cytochrome subunit|uniref:c-type cytochrome n=1 Tax=Ideonella sp. TaxID=1929293 RepID=UPI0037BEE604